MFRKLAGLTAIAGLFLAGAASAAITNTAHDLRTDLGLTDICTVCHAPHENDVNAEGELLWNHTATTANFTAYSSPTLDGASSGPGATSVLCLGCHDGTVAVDSYGGAAGTTLNTIGAVGGNFAVAAFGDDLSNDHPIGINYNPASDAELNATGDPADFGSGPGTVAEMLQVGRVECASCHDVHNTLSAGNLRLLNVSNAGSGLCLTCHAK